MTADDYYYWSEDWRLETIERTHDGLNEPANEFFLENSSGGKIIIDKPVNDVLEFLATSDKGNNFTEIDRQGMVSSSLLKILLNVFVQVGVLKINVDENETNKVVRIDLLEQIPFISIVIINYNGIKHLPALMTSLMEQSYMNFEIIIVDNYSTDDSCRWIKKHYRGIRFVELRKNMGFAAGVNEGLRKAQGEFILVLNNDIVLDVNAIYYLVKKALKLSKKPTNKKWAAIVPKMKFFYNPAFINAIGNSLYPITWGSDNFIGSDDLGQFDNFTSPMSACFGAVLLNPKGLANIGPLDPKYKFYYEDMDWCFRAHLCRHTIETATDAVFYHKFGASMNTESQAFKLRFIVSNRLYFTLKILEKQTIRRFLGSYIFEDIKSALIYLKRKNFPLVGAYIRAYARLFFSLPGLYFKRRRVQIQREDNDINDAGILSRAVPLNTTLMKQGSPVLDTFSLRTNYAFLETPRVSEKPEKNGDIICWRLHPPRPNKQAQEKIYMEFSFYLSEPGYYDIHLLGLIKRKSDRTAYLDGQLLKPSVNIDKKNKKLIMNFLVEENIFIPQGRHIVELGRRSQVYAIVMRKKMPPATIVPQKKVLNRRLT